MVVEYDISKIPDDKTFLVNGKYLKEMLIILRGFVSTERNERALMIAKASWKTKEEYNELFTNLLKAKSADKIIENINEV